jgi:hypothetical protein
VGLINEYPRDFKGVWFPKEIWLNEELTLLEKVVLVEIQSLDCGIDGCYATNSYIAKFCQCSSRKASDAISKLNNLDLIHIWYDEKNARHMRVNEGKLREAFNQFDEMEENARVENSARGDSKICEGGTQNLLSINIPINNNDNKKDIYTEKSETAKEEKPKKKRKTEPKKTYGEYGWVKLSDRQYDDLREKYNEEDILAGIEYVDHYCETHKKGRQYSNFKVILDDWGISGALERKERYGNRNNYKQNNANSAKQGTSTTVSADPSEQYTKEQWADIEQYHEENREDLPWL